jgi:hypothetical protein
MSPQPISLSRAFARCSRPKVTMLNSEVDEGHTSGRASSPWKARSTVNFVNFARSPHVGYRQLSAGE